MFALQMYITKGTKQKKNWQAFLCQAFVSNCTRQIRTNCNATATESVILWISADSTELLQEPQHRAGGENCDWTDLPEFITFAFDHAWIIKASSRRAIGAHGWEKHEEPLAAPSLMAASPHTLEMVSQKTPLSVWAQKGAVTVEKELWNPQQYLRSSPYSGKLFRRNNGYFSAWKYKLLVSNYAVIRMLFSPSDANLSVTKGTGQKMPTNYCQHNKNIIVFLTDPQITACPHASSVDHLSKFLFNTQRTQICQRFVPEKYCE